MAGCSWRKALSEFLKKDVSKEVLLKACKKMRGECEQNDFTERFHVAAIQPWPTSSASDAECIETMKLLMRTAKEVKSFIQGCRRDNWIQAAMVLANMSKHVCQLSYNMKFCRFLFPEKIITVGDGWRALAGCESCVFTDSELVKEIVSRDQRALLARLEAVNRSSNSSEQESYLARSLSSRLSHRLSESVQLNRESPKSVQLGGWEIPYSSLRPKCTSKCI